MISHCVTASFLGAFLGAMYGFLFVQRVKNSVLQKRPRSFVSSFFISYCLIAMTIFTLMTVSKINIVWILTFFLVTFWVVVWKNVGRLSL